MLLLSGILKVVPVHQIAEINERDGHHKEAWHYLRQKENIFRKHTISQLGKTKFSESEGHRGTNCPIDQARNQKNRATYQTMKIFMQKSKSIQGNYSKINSFKKILSSELLEMKQMKLYQNIDTLFVKDQKIKKQKQAAVPFNLYGNLIKLKRKYRPPSPNIQNRLNLEKSMIQIQKIKDYIAKKLSIKGEIPNNFQNNTNSERRKHARILTQQQTHKLLAKGQRIKSQNCTQFIVNKEKGINKVHGQVCCPHEQRKTHKKPRKQIEQNGEVITTSNKRQIEIMRWDTDMDDDLQNIEENFMKKPEYEILKAEKLKRKNKKKKIKKQTGLYSI